MDDNRYKHEGGCAFPFTEQGIGGETTVADPGMTLRDWFAGQALIGMTTHIPMDAHSANDRASWAYMQADAMLAARTGEE